MYTYNKTSTPNILNSTPYISIHLTKEKKERIRYSYFFVLWQTQTLKWPKEKCKVEFWIFGDTKTYSIVGELYFTEFVE